jgi:tRNA modification GTPase
MQLDDTIVAIATPPGRGGIGVVRFSGPQARSIAAPMLRLRHALAPGRALFGDLIEPASGERIDEVVVTYFAKPHSYTTDDVIEIAAHGSPIVLRQIVEMGIAGGARLAEPGEFTMRAFLNGRIDLTQAEAVRDLIESQTLFQAKAAAQQLEGALSKRLKPIKEQLVQLIAVLEAGVDFAEDDVAVLADEQILARIAAVRAPLHKLAESFAYGKVVHEGLSLAIVGRPNVGKSSLFNRLVERERAIVTSTPGTTRDLVTETVAIGGIPIRLIDTAGIRAASDEAESIGIQKTREALAEADLVLVVLDATTVKDLFAKGEEAWPLESELLEGTSGRKRILVMNKIDLAKEAIGLDVPRDRNTGIAFTSALSGDGVDHLRAEILKQIGGDTAAQHETGFLTNARHHGLVNDSLRALEAADKAVRDKIPHEMLLLDLYSALKPVDAISGATSTDDILNLIFGSFCIGK